MQAKESVCECCLVAIALVCIVLPNKETKAQTQNSECTTSLDAQLIATEAYIYFYPLLLNYRVLFDQTALNGNPFNEFVHRTELLDASITTVVSPNDDTLYSSAWLDLRAEPLVLSVPEVPQTPRRRYYSIQFVDGYSHNADIIGLRTTGSGPGNYLVAESTWKGEVPQLINKTIYIESDYALIIVRIIVYDQNDTVNLMNIQNQLLLTPLSTFLNSPSPPSSGSLNIIQVSQSKFLTLEYFDYVNHILQNIRLNPTEEWLFEWFARIGIQAGESFPPPETSVCVEDAILIGIEQGYQAILDYSNPDAATHQGWTVSIDPPTFGNRSVMQGRYIARAAGSRTGMYGLDPDEAYYPNTFVDAEGDVLDASLHNYTLTIHPDQIPEVNGFWSITMYNEDLHLVDNEINRYSIGDRTHHLHLQNNTLILIIQKDKPMDTADVDNWLPAPDGLFVLIARIFWTTEETLNKAYLPQGVQKSSMTF